MKIKLDKGAIAPRRATEGAAGLDLYSHEEIVILPGDRTVVDTGVHIQLEPDEVADVRGRSSMSLRGLLVATGTIDSDYRGSLGVVIYNLSPEEHYIHYGDRIAQLVIYQARMPEVEVVKELDETRRGSGGFGSTGR